MYNKYKAGILIHLPMHAVYFHKLLYRAIAGSCSSCVTKVKTRRNDAAK